jgi:hypothetical protein
MGYPELGGRICHTAGIGDRHEDVKVAQLDAAASPV